MKSLKKCVACIGALLLCGGISQAGILVANNSPDLNVTSVPPPGAQGYVFYDTNDTIGNWTNTGTSAAIPVPYVYISPGPDVDNSSGPGWTNLTISGSATPTGVFYLAAAGNTIDTLDTIQLTDTNGSTTDGAAIANFQLGILANNATSGANNYTTYLVTSNHGDSLTITPQDPSSMENDFYFVDVEGAHAGDVITIAAPNYNQGVNECLGGLTFDTIAAVPEPGSLGILALAGGLLLRRRGRAL